jgi:AmiR/NasT family two-component response regulator
LAATVRRVVRVRGVTQRVGRLTCVTDDVYPLPSPPAQKPVRAVRTRILVAEDEALIRLDLAEMLVEAGYDVVGQASNGEQAVALSRELKPDLVLMDVKMPVLDGISAADQIGRERIAPVVMLTAFSQKELVERARDAGVMAYIVKPFTVDDIAPAISIARSRWVEMHALEAEIVDLGERFETRKLVDRAKGVLMAKLMITEPEAFSWIQKAAMDRRMGMREVASTVISGMADGSPTAKP